MGIGKSLTISTYYQTKISIVSACLVILVLYVHAYFINPDAYPFSQAVLPVVERLSYRAINPTYFAISGFLFFFGIGKAADCFPKMWKRVRTVLIPFVLWNIIAAAAYLIFSRLPGTRVFMHRDIIGQFQSFGSAFCFLFVKPASFHLWFLRDLILYVAFSPIVFWMIKRFGWLAFLFLLIATPPLTIWLEYSHIEIAFFALGGTIALRSDLDAVRSLLTRNLVICAATVYFGLSVAWNYLLSSDALWEGYLALVFSISGMIVVWRGYDWLTYNFDVEHSRMLLLLANYSFFIYLFHEPILYVFIRMGLRLLGISDFTLSLLYFINPILIVILGILLAKGIKALSKPIYSVLVGGRVRMFHATGAIRIK